MEKLIELLNEREVGEEGGDLYYLSNGIIRDDGGNILYDYRIISKEFGFIKWLVENDKIDLDAQAMQYAKSDLSKFFTEWEDKNGMSDDYAMLLMLLSIQDEPIEFLVSILK